MLMHEKTYVIPIFLHRNLNMQSKYASKTITHVCFVVISILAWEFVTQSCLKPQNPCLNHEIHVLFEHGSELENT